MTLITLTDGGACNGMRGVKRWLRKEVIGKRKKFL